ncbi:unnamed protein product [Prorocentrum cordatum]|uniref:PSI domain-containing protein n=1 Tax=Prorocentrum cordatum TaxID=2364126 RepID=A0ABN9RDE6_9DINO|nr:unnamed protein product [Polarella glacialis]
MLGSGRFAPSPPASLAWSANPARDGRTRPSCFRSMALVLLRFGLACFLVLHGSGARVSTEDAEAHEARQAEQGNATDAVGRQGQSTPWIGESAFNDMKHECLYEYFDAVHVPRPAQFTQCHGALPPQECKQWWGMKEGCPSDRTCCSCRKSRCAYKVMGDTFIYKAATDSGWVAKCALNTGPLAGCSGVQEKAGGWR